MAEATTIIIQGQLAALNDHDKANRAHKFKGAKLKSDMTDFVALQCMGKPKIIGPCIISFDWYISTRHDPDNIRFSAKYLLDGMVKAGVLKGDTQKDILAFGGDNFIRCKKGEEKIILTIKEYENE